MNFKTAAKVTVVAGASVLFLAACGSSKSSSSSKQTANWTESAELPTMDISKSTDVVSSNALNNTNEGLTGIKLLPKTLFMVGNGPLIQRLRHNTHTYIQGLRTLTLSSMARSPFLV